MDEISLVEYCYALRRRWRVIAATVLLAVLAAGAYILIAPRVYRGQAMVMFATQDNGSGLAGALSGLGNLQGLLGSAQSGVRSPGTYAEILKSRKINQQVVDDMGLGVLDVDYTKLRDQLDIGIAKGGTMDISCYAPTSWAESGKLAWLERKYPGMSAKEKTANLAAEMANDYVARLRDFDSLNSGNSATRQRSFVENEVAKNRRELSNAEDAFRRFQEKHPVVPPPESTSDQVRQVIELRKEQIEAQAQMNVADRSILQAQALVSGQPQIQSSAKVIAENPVVSELKTELAKAEVAKAQLLEDRTDRNPDVVDASQQIDKLREKIAVEVAKVTQSETLQLNPVRQALVQNLATLQIQRSGTQALLTALNGAMERVEAQLSDLAADEMRYVRLLREVKAREQVYLSLVGELSKAKLAEAKEPDPFTVVDYAQPEKKHVKPRGLLTLLAALMLGTIIGSVLAIVLEGARPAKKVADRGTRTMVESIP